MHAVLRVLAAFAFLALLPGCVPESHSPASPPGDLGVDGSALGDWAGTVDDIPTEIHIAQRNEAILDVTVRENWGPDENGQDDWSESHYWVHFTDAGDYYVLNVAFDSDYGTRYYFADYGFNEDGSLTLWFMSETVVTEEIRSGRLAGEITSDEYGDSVTITAAPEAILAMIRTHPREEMFDFAYGPFYRR